MEQINIKLSTEVLRSLSSISWQVPSLVPPYHSHSWDLSSLEQYFTLSLSTLKSSDYHTQDTPYQQLSISLHFAHVFIDYVQHFERTKVFTIDFPSDKRSQAYCCWNTAHFFFFLKKDDSSNLWEVAMCLSKLLWIMVWFHCHCPFCTLSLKTAHPYGWMRLEMRDQSIVHLNLFSFNPRLAGNIFLSA